MKGSPSHRPDLRALSMELCDMCVILSAKNHILVDKTLVDKESILANLNLKGMSGDDVEDKIKSIGSKNYHTSYMHFRGGGH